MRQVELKANKEKFKAKLFMKDDKPTIDKLKVQFIVSDTSGREQRRAAFKEIDLAQHLGNDYIEQVYDLELAQEQEESKACCEQVALLQSFRVRIFLSCDKED